jgi:hypothetical protein
VRVETYRDGAYSDARDSEATGRFIFTMLKGGGLFTFAVFPAKASSPLSPSSGPLPEARLEHERSAVDGLRLAVRLARRPRAPSRPSRSGGTCSTRRCAARSTSSWRAKAGWSG